MYLAHFKNYSPSSEEKNMFENVHVLSDGIMSSDKDSFLKAKEYFSKKGAFGITFKDQRHEQLFQEYQLFNSLINHASAEGRDSDISRMIEKMDEIKKLAKSEGYEL